MINKIKPFKNGIRIIFAIFFILLGIFLGFYFHILRNKLISQFFPAITSTRPTATSSVPFLLTKCIKPTPKDRTSLYNWARSRLANPTNREILDMIRNSLDNINNKKRFIDYLQKQVENMNFQNETQARQYIIQLINFNLKSGILNAEGSINCGLRETGDNLCRSISVFGQSDEAKTIIAQFGIDGTLKIKITGKETRIPIRLVLKRLEIRNRVSFIAQNGVSNPQNPKEKHKIAHVIYSLANKPIKVGNGEIQFLFPGQTMKSPLGGNIEVKYGLNLKCRF
jgi:hypothetical protein